MHITKEQILSWYERLSFLKNEIQAELDVQLDQQPALVTLNEALNDCKGKVVAYAKSNNISLSASPG